MTLKTLTEMPESQRQDQWEWQFLEQIVPAKVQIVHDEPRPGPDGFPYIHLRTDTGDEPFLKVVNWAASRGIGLVINPHKMMPDYVFTFGMLWNFVETGKFVAASDTPPTDLKIDSETIMGAPTDAYLPPYVRSILKEFLAAQGFPSPRILVATSKDFKQTDLVFSVESLAAIEPQDHPVLAEAMGWFLPTHYSLVFASEKKLPKFFSL